MLQILQGLSGYSTRTGLGQNYPTVRAAKGPCILNPWKGVETCQNDEDRSGAI